MEFHLRGRLAILFCNMLTDVAHLFKYSCIELSHRKTTHFLLQPSHFVFERTLLWSLNMLYSLYSSQNCGIFVVGSYSLAKETKMQAGAALCLSSVYVWFSCPFVRFLLILCNCVVTLQTCPFDWHRLTLLHALFCGLKASKELGGISLSHYVSLCDFYGDFAGSGSKPLFWDQIGPWLLIGFQTQFRHGRGVSEEKAHVLWLWEWHNENLLSHGQDMTGQETKQRGQIMPSMVTSHWIIHAKSKYHFLQYHVYSFPIVSQILPSSIISSAISARIISCRISFRFRFPQPRTENTLGVKNSFRTFLDQVCFIYLFLDTLCLVFATIWN